MVGNEQHHITLAGTPDATANMILPDGLSKPAKEPTVKRSGSRKKNKCLNSHRRTATEISILQKEVAAKLALAEKLEREHSQLSLEHQLLVECCDTLHLLRLQHGDADDVEQEERDLLKQLEDIPYGLPQSSSCSHSTNSSTASGTSTDTSDNTASGAAVSGDPLELRLSPPDDKMYYFKYMLSLPPFPGAEHMTVHELANNYACTVRDLALQLHLLHRPVGLDANATSPLPKIKDLIDRHLNLISTLALQQRTDLIESFTLTNFETLEAIEEPRLDQHAWVVNAAGMTQSQQALIAHGMNLFQRLLTPCLEQRMQLQQQIAAEQLTQGVPRRGALAAQETKVAQLTRVLRKEYVTRTALCCWIAGCLTYVQVANMAVNMTPFPLSFTSLGKVVQQHYNKQQAMQHQQQQPKQQQDAGMKQ